MIFCTHFIYLSHIDIVNQNGYSYSHPVSSVKSHLRHGILVPVTKFTFAIECTVLLWTDYRKLIFIYIYLFLH